MTATYAQTITRVARAFQTTDGDTEQHLTLNMQIIAAADAAGIDHVTAFMDLCDEIAAPPVYVPQVGDIVTFHGDKAGHVSGSGGVGPYPVRSDDTRDEPYTMFWLHAHEMTPVFG